MGRIDELMDERRRKLKELQGWGVDAYPHTFKVTHSSSVVLSDFAKLEKAKEKVSVAGRVVSLRNMGKAAFLHIQDSSGKMQSYLKKDILKDSFKYLKRLDIGDFIGIKGPVFKTKTGEITVEANELAILAKSLRPLPEKWHGLQDTELRYRQRYLDLIMNPEVKQVFEVRSKIISGMRRFMDDLGLLEVETPTLQTIYGGAAAQPFVTHHNALDIDLYLRISNELYLKRLVIGGFEGVYEFCKDFRNEGIDRTHNPEFTMMEVYWAYKDYNDMMELTENMMSTVCEAIHGTTKITYQGTKLDLKPPWERLSMKDAIKKYAKIDVDKLDDKQLEAEVKKRKIEVEKRTRGWMINGLFEELVEEQLVGPVFITDLPAETSPLCKLHRNNPDLIERFEPYVMGFEVGNAYSELNDPQLQRKLLEGQAKDLRSGHEEAHPMDEDFVQAMEYGMPPMGGLGLGIDRWVMLFTDQPSIRDVVFFPTMRPKGDGL